MAKGTGSVDRPRKRSEYSIVFATRQASKGWTDLRATTLNGLADCWDYLTRTPTAPSPFNHQLRGDLATVVRGGVGHARWQYELPGGARIWFYVEGHTVYLVDVHTHHPNQTK